MGGETRGAGTPVTTSIHDVKRRHATRLLAIPGVVSVGIGLDASGEEAIVVGVSQPSAETRAALPTALEGYRIRVETLGPVHAR